MPDRLCFASGATATSETWAEKPEGVFPLALPQESLWCVDQFAPGNSAYNLAEAWRLEGDLDLKAFRHSLDQLVRRHETLRTVFRAEGGKPAQVILPAQPFAFQYVDAQAAGGGAMRRSVAGVLTRLEREARRPFDLQNGPLARAVLYRLSEQQHVVLLNVHHIVADEWSLGVLRADLARFYAAAVAGQTPDLPELPIQYADFAVWQREALVGAAFRHEIEYWTRELRGPLPGVSLPTDHPRPEIQSYRGATEFRTFDSALTWGLKDLGRAHGATLFMTLLAAFKALLHRYSRQEEIIVGSPMAGRERSETEGLIGLFVNTHALRTGVGDNPRFVDLLKRVKDVALGAHAHQHVSLQRLVEAVRPERHLNRHPLFNVVFGLQPGSAEPWLLPHLSTSRVEIDNGSAKFDWTLLLSESGQRLRVRSEYNTDLFRSSTVASMVQVFQTLLEAIVADPEKRVSELKLLHEAEQVRLISDLNRTTAPYERDLCVHKLFEKVAAARSQKTALIFQGRPMSYGELSQRAEQLAQKLQALGVGPEITVAVCLERSFELIISLLAILKAGGAYVPLDYNYPDERLSFLIQDSRARALITHAGFVARHVNSLSPGLIVVDAAGAALRETTPSGGATDPAQATPVAAAVTPEHLAYVMYTSGSTGTPKGVAVPHRGIVRLVRNTNYVAVSPADVFLQLAPVSFDASTFEIWGALLNGCTLVVASPGVPSLEQLARTVQGGASPGVSPRVSVLWLTSSLFNQMVDYQLAGLKGVRQLLIGGEALSVKHVLRALAELKDCQLINGYGPTENTTFTCCYRIPPDWQGGVSVPVGTPISNTRVYVLDEHFQPLPTGVPGELYTAGDGLARGYLNRPELTNERFLTGCAAVPEARLYRTGDLVRLLPDGGLEFLRRLDDQVKIHGFRIEPGEVQSALDRHPAVSQAVVAARPGSGVDKQLVAYVVPKPGASIDIDELRLHLESELPAFMLPASYVVLEALPLTPNGKVDRRALPAPQASRPADEAAIPPRTDTERLLATIWEEVLGRNSFGVHHNFFQLGGHSLLATQVISRIARATGVELPLQVIFESPTIAVLAKVVEDARANGTSNSSVIGQRDPRNRAADLLAHLDQLSDTEVAALLQDPEWTPAAEEIHQRKPSHE
jgi:amino acid adenylation domain-containing protein